MFRRFFGAIGNVFRKIFGFTGGSGDAGPFFPSIPVDSISSRLKLTKRGALEGEKNIPPPDQSDLSATEHEIYSSVETIRSAALNKFESWLSTFDGKITSAKAKFSEMELLVNTAEIDFKKTILARQGFLLSKQAYVESCHQELVDFRERNRIIGPPKPSEDTFTAIVILVVTGAIETVLNTLFFADRHTLGALGGFLTALIISIVNIGATFMGGIWSRHINLRSIIRKIFGFLVIIATIAFAITLNFMVAHFRDAIGIYDWDAAMIEALKNFRRDFLNVNSAYSWLIFCTGGLVSIISFWKGQSHFDKYPNHYHLWKTRELAFDDYAKKFNDVLNEFQEVLANAREELQTEARNRHDDVMSAIHALFAKDGLVSGLHTFLQRCDQALNELLNRYRSANQEARKEPPPGYFMNSQNFPDYNNPALKKAEGHQEEVKREIEKMNVVVSNGVEKISVGCSEAMDSILTLEKVKDGLVNFSATSP